MAGHLIGEGSGLHDVWANKAYLNDEMNPRDGLCRVDVVEDLFDEWPEERCEEDVEIAFNELILPVHRWRRVCGE